MCLQIIYLTYMYKQDMALNNLLWLIYPNQTRILYCLELFYAYTLGNHVFCCYFLRGFRFPIE